MASGAARAIGEMRDSRSSSAAAPALPSSSWPSSSSNAAAAVAASPACRYAWNTAAAPCASSGGHPNCPTRPISDPHASRSIRRLSSIALPSFSPRSAPALNSSSVSSPSMFNAFWFAWGDWTPPSACGIWTSGVMKSSTG